MGTITEESMRRHFGLPVLAHRAKQALAKEKPAITRGLVVIMTVRRDNGPTRRHVHFSKSLFRLSAEMEAKDAIRAMKLTPWALLDVLPHDEYMAQQRDQERDQLDLAM